jgi:hypothetical protein
MSIMAIVISTLLLKNGVEPALVVAGQTLDAFFLVDAGHFLLFPDNGIGRAGPEAHAAAGAGIRFHFKP